MKWSVTHDAQQGRDHLATVGELPPEFNSILSQLRARQQLADKSKRRVDFIFDVPVELARSIVGYRYDRDVPGISGKAFEVLVGGSPRNMLF